jgi:hypothetical protein|tara:strand:+ start:301 stop:480 length:180 start_codon:yes stop_codon:yes gene_type:complete
MQLKYNRQQNLGNSFIRFLIKFLLVIILSIVAFFLIEKINFPSPQKNFEIDITNEIKKL